VTNSKVNVIGDEPAAAQVDLIYDYYDIDFEDYKSVSAAQNEAADILKVSYSKLKKAVMRGQIEAAMDGGDLFITVHLTGRYDGIPEKKMVLKPYSGNASVEMEKIKGEGKASSKMFALFGLLSGLGAAKIQGFYGPDLKVVEVLNSVFLL
jgi:hypothetical protein